MKQPSLFGFNSITNEQAVMWVKVLSEETTSKEEILSDMQLIDDLLTLQNNFVLINGLKKRGQKVKLKDLLEARIAKDLDLPWSIDATKPHVH